MAVIRLLEIRSWLNARRQLLMHLCSVKADIGLALRAGRVLTPSVLHMTTGCDCPRMICGSDCADLGVSEHLALAVSTEPRVASGRPWQARLRRARRSTLASAGRAGARARLSSPAVAPSPLRYDSAEPPLRKRSVTVLVSVSARVSVSSVCIRRSGLSERNAFCNSTQQAGAKCAPALMLQVASRASWSACPMLCHTQAGSHITSPMLQMPC